MIKVRKGIDFIACMCSFFVFLNCGTTNQGKKFTPFFVLESGKSIAVVSGHNDDNDIRIAEIINDKLIRSGKFKILSQSEISQKVPMYPLNVNLIDFSLINNKDEQNTPYLSDTSKKKIDSMQKLIKADYILVVWVEKVTTMQNETVREVILASRLISYPEANIIGYSYRLNEIHSYCCLFSVKWKDVFDNATSELAEEILKNISIR